ncbi:MAG: DNA ligase [Planctomycetes bacterium]|nr:DNA ligase [Planctomycetota bacterium]
MPDLKDGETAEVQGSARLPYIIKNVGGVYSCSCPAWRNQSLAIERRSCKHLRQYRGEEAEQERLGALPPVLVTNGHSTTQAPALLLAHTWDNETDLTDWYLSEKLDGVRAYWDGQQFLSRQGNVFHAPDWFVEGLPSEPLDVELWLDRKAFQRTVSIVRRQDKSDHWRQIKYVTFDMPSVAAPFEERYEQLWDTLASNRCNFATVLDQYRCQGVEHLQQELSRINGLGGEGLMLRQPASRYEAGRSHSLLKVKTFHDAEAWVLDHLPGTGRHTGRLGALAVALENGTQFSVGTGFTDAQRENPPPVGSCITFRYQELTDRGVPRFPSFVRMRTDNVQHGALPAGTQPASQRKRRSKEKSAMKRHFEFVEGNSAKFWEVSTSGKDVTIWFGRIGTDGQTQTKTFDDPVAAQKHADKMVQQKTRKGYQELAAK